MENALPPLYALFLWWFSTGLVLFLDGLPARTFRWSLLGASALAVVSLHGLVSSSGHTTPSAAFAAFTCAVLVWGWNEVAFLMGFVTGPRRRACPEGCRGWRHLGHAIQTLLYHELALAASGALVIALTWEAANRVGAWTFLILWCMRLSTKLNVFLGVPNLSEEFLPEHLQYLRRYFRRRPMNLLFPVSVTVSTLLTALLLQRAILAEAGSHEATSASLLASLMVLAVLEHWFLVLPLPFSRLWRSCLRSRSLRRPEASSAAGEAGHREGGAPARCAAPASARLSGPR